MIPDSGNNPDLAWKEGHCWGLEKSALKREGSWGTEVTKYKLEKSQTHGQLASDDIRQILKLQGLEEKNWKHHNFVWGFALLRKKITHFKNIGIQDLPQNSLCMNTLGQGWFCGPNPAAAIFRMVHKLITVYTLLNSWEKKRIVCYMKVYETQILVSLSKVLSDYIRPLINILTLAAFSQ